MLIHPSEFFLYCRCFVKEGVPWKSQLFYKNPGGAVKTFKILESFLWKTGESILDPH